MPATEAAATFNPYARLRHWRLLAWWNAVLQTPGQAALHGLVVLCLLGLALPLGQRAISAMLPWLQGGWDRAPVVIVSVIAALALTAQLGVRRRQAATWRKHWLRSQPMAAAVERFERRRLLLVNAALQAGLIALLAFAAERPGLLGSLPLVALAALLADRIAIDRLPLRAAPRIARIARITPFRFHGRGSLLRWQWQQMGSTLAPRRLTPLWLVWLAMPRGPASLALIAAYLMLLLALLQAWRIGLQVIPHADAWLRWQPLAARRWLARACLLPMMVLFGLALAIALPAWFGNKPQLALLVLPLLLAFALLHLACVLAWRAEPRRIPRQFGLHALLQVACLQTLPPLVPALWLIQMALLLRRALRVS